MSQSKNKIEIVNHRFIWRFEAANLDFQGGNKCFDRNSRPSLSQVVLTLMIDCNVLALWRKVTIHINNCTIAETPPPPGDLNINHQMTLSKYKKCHKVWNKTITRGGKPLQKNGFIKINARTRFETRVICLRKVENYHYVKFSPANRVPWRMQSSFG